MTTERIGAFYRDATDKDVARVMKREEVEARFSDETTAFFISTLGGWQTHRPYEWLDGDGSGWQFCQVYDPPQWYVDKPDPGEGYRLLGKFPDEEKLPTDEFFADNQWRETKMHDGKQVFDIWYRRRIDPPKPEPKHYTLNVGDTAETPSLLRIAVTEHGIEVQ